MSGDRPVTFRSRYPSWGGGVVLNFAGVWATGVPGPTSGTAFTTQAGVLRGTASAQGFNTANTGVTVEAYIDGVYQGAMTVQPTHALSQHLTLSPLAIQTAVTAGTHYLAFRQIAGTSGTNDFGSFFGVVTPT